MAFDFLTWHILQARLPLILLVLKIWFRSIHKLLHTNQQFYILQRTTAKLFLLLILPLYFSPILQRQSSSLSPWYRNENTNMPFSFTRDHTQPECYMNRFVQSSKRNHRAEMWRQTMIKVASKKPHPSLSVWVTKLSMWLLSRTGQQ